MGTEGESASSKRRRLEGMGTSSPEQLSLTRQIADRLSPGPVHWRPRLAHSGREMLATDSVTGAGIPMALARAVMLPADAISPMKSTSDLVDEGLRLSFQVSYFPFTIFSCNCFAPGISLILSFPLCRPSSTT